jgi:hypothetical protein
MAQQPTSAQVTQDQQSQNAADNPQPEPLQPEENQEIPLAASGQQTEAPPLPSVGELAQEDEAPGWTEHGGMAQQQASALEYNEYVNEPHDAHNASLASEQQNSEPASDELQEARDRAAAVNDRADQGQQQQMENEPVIGD